MDTVIQEKNQSYWTQRASGYSRVNREELDSKQHCIWQKTLCGELSAHFPHRSHSSIRVLDVGCGPGFFSIVLAEQGYDVTAIDLTPAMLEQAKINAGSAANNIRFMEMDAQFLTFDDQSFDAVITRNLTWNLPDPEQAYHEWIRVLCPGGVLLNFDANWYHYLFQENARKGYLHDREQSRQQGIHDENLGENFEIMEQIASRLPLSKTLRPQWDRSILESMDVTVTLNEYIWNQVWSPEERINFASTPMFLICGKK